MYTLNRLQEDKLARKNLEDSARSLGQKAAAAETRAVAAEGDLRIEREWRVSLQVSITLIIISIGNIFYDHC